MGKISRWAVMVLALFALAGSAPAQTAGAPAPDATTSAAAPGAAAPDASATPKPKRKRARKPAGDKAATGATTTKATRTRGTAYVRVLHAIAGGPAVDVYLDDQKVLTGAAFKAVSDYMPVKSGKHTLKITATGKTEPLLTAAASHTKDKFYTVAAYGTPAKPLLLRVNETTGKAIEGKARLYIVHLAEGSALVDVTSPSTRTKAGYANVLKKVAFGKSRAKTATPGTMTLQVRADGKVINEESGVRLEAGKRYSAFVVGKAGATGRDALDIIAVPASTSSSRD